MLEPAPSVTAKAPALEVYDSTSQFPRMYTTYFLHSLFFLMGSGLGTYWQLDLASSAKKIKMEVRYIYHLKISHLSHDGALSLSKGHQSQKQNEGVTEVVSVKVYCAHTTETVSRPRALRPVRGGRLRGIC